VVNEPLPTPRRSTAHTFRFDERNRSQNVMTASKQSPEKSQKEYGIPLHNIDQFEQWLETRPHTFKRLAHV
jgi:hypothetical protein